MTPEPRQFASVVRIGPRTAGSRSFDAISVTICDLHLRADLVCDRDIRLAWMLCQDHGAQWLVHDSLQTRVDAALRDIAKGRSE